jgi:alpha-galactosidase
MHIRRLPDSLLAEEQRMNTQKSKNAMVTRVCRAVAMAALVGGLMNSGRARADEVQLGELDVSKVTQEWGRPQANKSVENRTLSVAGQTFERGLGLHAASTLYLELDGQSSRFQASVGIDDEVKDDPRAKDFPVEFRVLADGKVVYKSGPMRVGDAARPVDVSLTGVTTLLLQTRMLVQNNMFAHTDWADAKITYSGKKPTAVAAPVEEPYILTPAPAKTPRINSAKVYGVRPGRPVIYKIAVTGERPITYAAAGLPDGLTLDEKTGVITGNAPAGAGTHAVSLKATNALGSAEQKLRIEVGDKIALTPPMGWNSWNCFAEDVSDAKVRAVADVFEKSGLIDHGWTYINIDDCWQLKIDETLIKNKPLRENGRVLTNSKFPDMKALTDYIHAKGLKAGIYSSPGPATCAGYTGSYKSEEADARQYAAWGFDYLKYDWCSFGSIADRIRRQPNRPSELNVVQKPYQDMQKFITTQSRDIVYSLCQYGMGDVWQWGESVDANCWRTTGDIADSWTSMSGIGFSQNGHEKYAGPGHWNDPDMLVLGKVGWGPRLHQTVLTPSEQYTHISLWSMLASPLLIGCDLTQLDDFTKNLLTNDEVIAINQDPLGRQAKRVVQNTEEETEVWTKEMEDGSLAVGLFNRGEVKTKISVTPQQLGLSGPQSIRDVWRQKDVGEFGNSVAFDVARHGVVLLKISPTGR